MVKYGSGFEIYELEAFDVIEGSVVPISSKNNYKVLFFAKYNVQDISAKDMPCSRIKKWDRLKASSISLSEQSGLAFMAWLFDYF